jgi:hypothetical protein
MIINPPKTENLTPGLKRKKLTHKGLWSPTPDEAFIIRPPKASVFVILMDCGGVSQWE